MLPTPPIITTTSAFMVNSTPMAGLKVRKVLTSVPATATSAPPQANASADMAGVDADQAAPVGSMASARIAAPKRVRVRNSQMASPNAGDAECEHPVGGEREADDAHRRVEIVVEAVVRREGELRRALEHEQQAEGGEDGAALEVVAGAGAPHQRQHQQR